jgi:hypothetical protein
MKRFLLLLVLVIECSVTLPLLAQTSGTLADASGTITTGGSSQQILAAAGTGGAAPRRFLAIQNLEATDHLWVNFGAAAPIGVGSFDIAPGATIWFDYWVVNSSVTILGPTTGDKFTCKYR